MMMIYIYVFVLHLFNNFQFLYNRVTFVFCMHFLGCGESGLSLIAWNWKDLSEITSCVTRGTLNPNHSVAC